MSVWSAMAGGFAGTIALTTVLRSASELRLTRIDLPFLLGTIVTVDRQRAKALGYAFHFGFGLLFAGVYYVLFAAVGRSGWFLGALFGIGHATFAAGVLVNVLLPFVHPRIGSPSTAADAAPLIEPPGFMLLNYGPTTPLVTIAAHIAYGALVGGFTQLLN